MIIKSSECMDSRKTMKVVDIQNIEKVIYHPTDWIIGVEYEENYDNPNYPDTTETKYDDYNIG